MCIAYSSQRSHSIESLVLKLFSGAHKYVCSRSAILTSGWFMTFYLRAERAIFIHVEIDSELNSEHWTRRRINKNIFRSVKYFSKLLFFSDGRRHPAADSFPHFTFHSKTVLSRVALLAYDKFKFHWDWRIPPVRVTMPSQRHTFRPAYAEWICWRWFWWRFTTT